MGGEQTEESMATLIVEWVADRRQFFKRAFLALKVSNISGDYVEFGSWGGQTLRDAYDVTRIVGPPRPLWAFDTFLGERPAATSEIDSRPELERYRNQGPSGLAAFLEVMERKGVPTEAFTAVEGYFDDTLTTLGPDQPPNDIALAYVDCNLYSSTVTVLDFLAPRLKHGMIVAFDDYWVYKPD
jgi:O-methyltransferase